MVFGVKQLADISKQLSFRYFLFLDEKKQKSSLLTFIIYFLFAQKVKQKEPHERQLDFFLSHLATLLAPKKSSSLRSCTPAPDLGKCVYLNFKRSLAGVWTTAPDLGDRVCLKIGLLRNNFFNAFFFLDEKETKSQDKTIFCTQAKLLRVLSGSRAASMKIFLNNYNWIPAPDLGDRVCLKIGLLKNNFLNTFFLLDEKETGQRCKGLCEPVCAAGSKERASLSQYFLCLETKKQNSRLFKIEYFINTFFYRKKVLQKATTKTNLKLVVGAQAALLIQTTCGSLFSWTPAPDLGERVCIKLVPLPNNSLLLTNN
jgi:hypothetical protein